MNSLGFNIEGSIRLRIIYTCYSSLSQLFIGDYGFVGHIPAMKWYLNFLMEHSDALQYFIPEGVNLVFDVLG